MATWTTRATLVAALCALPALGIAQNGMGKATTYAAKQFHVKFLQADKDKDGFLTKEEAEAGNLPVTARNFEAIDTTGRGKVSEKEVQAYLLKQAGARAARPPAGGG